jgi:cyclic pyranopterin phosphate synthase
VKASGRLTHVGSDGESRMVDVGKKLPTARTALAEALLVMRPATARLVRTGRAKKGNVLEVARIAGILAAKRTCELIPLCHPLAVTRIALEFSWPGPARLRIAGRVEVMDRTGVEMEALTAVSVAALTVYDMCKAVDRGMEIARIRLLEKSGGKSGTYMRVERRKRK